MKKLIKNDGHIFWYFQGDENAVQNKVDGNTSYLLKKGFVETGETGNHAVFNTGEIIYT